MPDFNKLAAAPVQWSQKGTGTNAVATAAQAGATGLRQVVTGFTVSASGAVAATVTVTLKDSTTNAILDEFVLPTGTLEPIIHDYTHPLLSSVGGGVSMAVPALGAGIVGEVILRGFTL